MTASQGASTGASALFQLLRDGEPRTRSELAAMTGLARSTISLRIDQLLELGLIKAVGEKASSGGRPPSRVALNPTSRIVAAADFGATHAIVAITNVVGDVIVQVRERLDIAEGPEVVLDRLVSLISRLIGESGHSVSDLAAIGIGLPGPVAHETGKPAHPPIMPGWHGFDVPGYVRRSFQVPVLVDNDVNIMALGERETIWPGVDHLMFVKVATGIGAGILSGGKLQRGAQGTAGDIGHVRIPGRDDIMCRCGNKGCLEAVAGGPAVAAGLQRQGLDVHGIEDVIERVRLGDLAAIQAVRQAGRDVGEVLTTCVSLINPSVIVLGGSLAQAGEHLIAGVREVIYASSMPLATEYLTIAQSASGDRAGIIGASLMAVEAALSPERVEAMAELVRA
jgi:predicted NBD/HSP70 family sugar kinase